MDQEIYIRPYIEYLLRHVVWIVAGALLAGLAAFAVVFFSPRLYQAQAAVTIARSRVDVTFDSRISTLSEDELASLARDTNARRDALVGLLKNGDIARHVLDEVGAELEPENRSVSALLNMVETSNKGDLLFVTAHHADAATAALIANTWANTYVLRVNQLYGNQPGADPEGIAQQIGTAKGVYETAESALESFVRENPINLVQQEIQAQKQLLDTYLAARDNVQSAPVELQLETRRNVLADAYAELQAIERWLSDAEALRDQVAADANSAAADLGNLVALIGLRSQVFGGAKPADLQLNLASGEGTTIEVLLADVDSLIAVLNDRRELTQARIDATSAALQDEEVVAPPPTDEHPMNVLITDVGSRIQDLEAELQALQAQKDELSQTRDLTWETYQSLVRKQAEDAIASESAGTEVRLAAAAVPPEKARPRGLVNTTLLSALLGAVVVTAGLVIVRWWREEGPFDDDSGERGTRG